MRPRTLLLALVCAITPPLAAQGVGDSAQRPAVQQLQRRILQVVQRTLGATDDQMRELVSVNRKYEEERRALNQKDREAESHRNGPDG